MFGNNEDISNGFLFCFIDRQLKTDPFKTLLYCFLLPFYFFMLLNYIEYIDSIYVESSIEQLNPNRIENISSFTEDEKKDLEFLYRYTLKSKE